MFDEMAIKKHLEYCGGKLLGRVDMGPNIECDENELAKEAFFLSAVAINDYWKVPFGYFLINGLTADQKESLVNQAVITLHEAGLRVISLTFDGPKVNIKMVEQLVGQSLDPLDQNFKTYFLHPITQTRIYIFPDPCHMFKLERNHLGDNDIITDDGVIKWSYIKELHDIQEKEGLHLGNKLRSRHINYKKQIMKVKLASQVFSDSVADSLIFLRDTIKDPFFKHCEETVKFIKIVNDLFDIMNSRNLSQRNFKQPINASNKKDFFKRLDECKEYFMSLQNPNGTLLINTIHKTGFLGLIICIESLKNLYIDICENEKILKFYV